MGRTNTVLLRCWILRGSEAERRASAPDGVLTKLQRRTGEGGENAVELPPSDDLVHGVVAALPFLARSKWQIINVRQPEVMRMVEAQRAVIEGQASFGHG